MWSRVAVQLAGASLLGVALFAQAPGTGTVRCRIVGRATSGTVPLPGVSIAAFADNALAAATSTEVDGTFTLVVAPDRTYRVSADLTGFVAATRDVPLSAAACEQPLDFQLTLDRGRRGATTESTANTTPEQTARGAAAAGRGGAAVAGRGGAPAAGRGVPGARFQSLDVQPDAIASAAGDGGSIDDASRLLPPGFSLDSADANTVSIASRGDATSLDRGMMNDRARMIDLGQLDPATGQLAQGFGPGEFGGRGGFAGPGQDGRGGFGPGAPGGRGFGGPAGFMLGGRGGRGQRPYQGSATYTFGGSVLDSPPYQLRPEVPVSQPQFTRNTFGGTFGGPLRIPGLYANTNRRTTFQVNYTGARTNNVFDQYATVPTPAQRAGDFSASALQLFDPATGQPFAGNIIPSGRIDPSAATLLQFIPTPNLPGTAENYHVSTIASTRSDAVSVRMIQNLSPVVSPPGGRNGGSGFGGGFGGGRGGGGRFGGPGDGRGTNVVLTGQLQYRRTETQAPNVFPTLGNDTVQTTVSAPLSLNVRRGRTINNFTLNLTHARTESSNAFAGVENVGALAGIQYPGTSPPASINWGVPNLFFTGFTGARSASASERGEDRLTAAYTWLHPGTRHQLRIGGNYRLDRSDATINGNSRGTFTFTGRYTSPDGITAPGSGADFADFLLGLPQQASLQVGGTSRLRQHSMSLFVEDNWQTNAKLTFNLGVRYELARPYVEVDGRMANLDAAPGLTAVTPVLPDSAGPYTGVFPASLLNTDTNNVAPRLGVAYRLRPNTILRAGYGIAYNSGSYASIARELAGQPPFAESETVAAPADGPLTLADALLAPATSTTNTWGVDRDYALGMIQTWNATITRNLNAVWMAQAGVTRIKGTDLDILRAPVLGVDVPLAAAQPFIWESSGGRSLMNGATFQIRRRVANGYGGAVSYAFAASMDNASSLGAGGPVVAQNDKDLAAEWAPSSFNRRHQLSANLYVELPWGPNRRWLSNGGFLAGLFGEWSAQLTMTLQSGTPVTARVLGAASDIVRGVNGSLRADYNGAPIALASPTVDEFFDVAAFSAPPPGEFGTSSRNMIVGPGVHQLDGLFQRDLRLGGTRSLTLQVNAINLLNTIQWAAIDTNVNSPTFGRVLSARPMRTMTITARWRF